MPRTRSLFAVRGARPARVGLSCAPASRHAGGVGPRNWRTGLRRGADARPLTLVAVSSFSPPAAIVRFEQPRPTGAESIVSIISRLGSVDTTRPAAKCNRHAGTTYGWYFFWQAKSTAATQRFRPVKARDDAYVCALRAALRALTRTNAWECRLPCQSPSLLTSRPAVPPPSMRPARLPGVGAPRTRHLARTRIRTAARRPPQPGARARARAAAALVNNRCLPRPCRQPRDGAARGARHSARFSAARDTLPSRRRRPRRRRGADPFSRAAHERGAGPEISAPPRRSHSAEAPRRNRRGRRGKISRGRSKARAEK